MRRLPKSERIVNIVLVLQTTHGRMYGLPGRWEGLFDIVRKYQILTGHNGQEGPRQDGFHLPPWPITHKLSAIRLKDAPGTIQRAMNVLLTKVKWRFAMVY